MLYSYFTDTERECYLKGEDKRWLNPCFDFSKTTTVAAVPSPVNHSSPLHALISFEGLLKSPQNRTGFSVAKLYTCAQARELSDTKKRKNRGIIIDLINALNELLEHCIYLSTRCCCLIVNTNGLMEM